MKSKPSFEISAELTIIRRCTKCGVYAPLTHYHPRKKGKYGKQSICKDCYRSRDAMFQKGKRTRLRQSRISSRINNLLAVDKRTLAYLAAIIDGEGTVSVLRRKEPRSSVGVYYYGRISAVNTSVELIDFISKSFQCGSVMVKGGNHLSKKPCYEWCAVGEDAGSVAEAILPYLVIKRRQAELLIELRKLMRDRSFLAFTDEAASRRLELYSESIKLNRRGGE